MSVIEVSVGSSGVIEVLGGGGGGVTDHGQLSGLSDNDHPQYVLRPSESISSKTVSDGTALTTSDLDVEVLKVTGSAVGNNEVGSLGTPTNAYHAVLIVGQSDDNLVVIPTSLSNVFLDSTVILGKGDYVILRYMNEKSMWVSEWYRRI